MTGPTLEDYAKTWYREQGIIPPVQIPELWGIMYRCWVNYAFAGLSGNKPNEYGIRPGKVYMEAGKA